MSDTRSMVALAAMCGAVATPLHATPHEYQINNNHSAVAFSISHFGYSNTLGAFRKISGTLSFDEHNLPASHVEVVIKSNSIDTGLAERDKDLRGSDFLDAQKFPDIRFESSKVIVTAGNALTVNGSLAMHGQTKPVSLNATFNKSAPNPFDHSPTVGFSATASVKRSDFGIVTYLPDVGDRVNITIEVEFSQAPAGMSPGRSQSASGS
jgi:polyisoprenoid-binding protein YceI